MTDDQKAAYVTAMAACAQIEALGMLAENLNSVARAVGGGPVPYRKKDFDALIEKHGIHDNAVMLFLRG